MRRLERGLIVMALPIAGMFACSLAGLSDGARDSGVSGTGGNVESGTGGLGGADSSSADAADAADASDAPDDSDSGTTCGNGKKDGTETDVDCGGGDCPRCAVDQSCVEGSDCSTRTCTQGVCRCASDMVHVPAPPPDGVAYCVDKTEVTNEQYDVFLQKNPSLANQAKVCAWNKSFEPSNFATLLQSRPKHPVVSVDWCDARAYCASLGKRLCGKLGGGSHPFALPQSGTNEWYVACSKAGLYTFVYGNTYDASACVDKDTFDGGSGTTFEVGSYPDCVGGYPGIFDMNGNVWEWEDSCDDVDGGDAAVASCRRRGGSFDDTQYCARCTTCGGAARARSAGSTSTGFRCCAG